MSFTARKFFALTILLITAIIGTSSFMAFLFFLYEGPVEWVHLGLHEAERLVFNAIISLAFFLQHSIMIRRPFRQRLSVLIPSYYQGAIYTLSSGLALFAFVTFWQVSDIILFEVHGLFAAVMRTFFSYQF